VLRVVRRRDRRGSFDATPQRRFAASRLSAAHVRTICSSPRARAASPYAQTETMDVSKSSALLAVNLEVGSWIDAADCSGAASAFCAHATDNHPNAAAPLAWALTLGLQLSCADYSVPARRANPSPNESRNVLPIKTRLRVITRKDTRLETAFRRRTRQTCSRAVKHIRKTHFDFRPGPLVPGEVLRLFVLPNSRSAPSREAHLGPPKATRHLR
jgi:hypothetical protein